MISWWTLVSIVAAFILTEVIFLFSPIKKKSDSFMEAKIYSILIAVLIVFFAFTFPSILSYIPMSPGDELVRPIVYVWYYGIIFAVIAFFGTNYYFYKKMKGGEDND